MARNSSGTHSLPAGNPVTTGTTISSTVHNNTTADLSTEITDSLSRTGKGAMLAPLELADGTVSLPALTFDTDPDSGLYRIGANNIALAVNGVKAVELATTAVTIPLGLVVTQDTAAGTGVTGTGNTTGPGGAFTGGVTGIGVTGTGGATGAAGGSFTGTNGNPGAVGTGDGGGDGLTGNGGSSSGRGGTFTGGGPNGGGAWVESAGNGTALVAFAGGTGVAVFGTGGGASAGGAFTSGDTDGAIGVTGTSAATNGNGGRFTATGTGYGVRGAASADASSFGVEALATAAGGVALKASSDDGEAVFAYSPSASSPAMRVQTEGGATGVGLIVEADGPKHIVLSGAAAASTDAMNNTLNTANVPKVWSSFTITGGNGGGNFVVGSVDGFNVTSVARATATTILVTFAQDFANTTYSAITTVNLPAATGYATGLMTRAAGTLTLTINQTTGAAIDLDAASNANVWYVNLLVFGRQ